MPSATAVTGAAGEHFIMAALLRRGCIAALAPEGVPNMDILVSDLDGKNQRGLQVKTRLEKGSDGGWHMSKKHEDLTSRSLFYSFVNFGPNPDYDPDVWILPSDTVAKVLRETHEVWLTTPGARGQSRKDSNYRRLVPDYSYAYKPQPPAYARGWMDPYKSAWHLLGIDGGIEKDV